MSNLIEIKEKGMFYTKDVISKLLVKNISQRRVNKILELGVGSGSLFKNALIKWKDAQYTCTDINENEFNYETNNPKINFLIESRLNANLISVLNGSKTEFDIAICNPPYLKVSIKDIEQYKSIIDQFDNSLFGKIKLISSEFIFLVQNILLLRKGGTLGIIVPDSILTRREFMPIRDSIIKNYNLLCSIELPEKIFSKTEAKTHILIIKNEKPKSDFVKVCLSNKEGVIIEKALVKRELLVERMDFKFLNFNIKNGLNQKKLDLKNIRVLRGNVTHAELKNITKKYIHSTTFKHGEKIVGTDNSYSKKYKSKVYAEKGDIIMVRVGRGCVGKTAKIISGKFLVSDCIFVFKSKKEKEISSFELFLNSKAGGSVIDNLIHGTCAKVISKTDIETLITSLGK